LKFAEKSHRSVLVVEDEAMIAIMLEDFLESLGLRLHGVATTLEDGCALAEAGGFDMAILDCNLGNRQVWPVADIITRSSIPFLLSSGGAASDIPPRFAQVPLLEKPYTISAITETLSKMEATH
jgi:CheY-like chemotaxis protein